mgnify:CR=1 FL=1
MSFNLYGVWAIYRFEMARALRTLWQSLVTPVITTSLYFAVFGGAISRIAAVQVARDEKISVRQALRFSLNKLLSFVFAPVIPLIILLHGARCHPGRW